MERRINPFIYGRHAPHTHFVGRREELDTCFNALVAPVCGSVAISGEPRMGKTSLLNAVVDFGTQERWQRNEARSVFLYVDCQSISRFTPTRFWQRVLNLLLRTVSNDPAASTIDAVVQPMLALDDIDATHFEAVLHLLHDHNITLMLLLDEFEWVIKRDVNNLPVTRNFLSGLRALINHSADALSLVIASQQPLNVLCQGIITGEGSPFYNNFVFRRLHPLAPSEVGELLERRLTGTPVQFNAQDRQYIDQIAGTHPFLVQLACALIFNARSQGALVEYDEIGRRFEEEARHHFSQTWENSSHEERTVLLLIAWRWWSRRLGLNPQPDDRTFWELMRRYEREIISLVERGLITGEDSQPSPISSVFAWWIVNTVRAGGQVLALPDPGEASNDAEADSISQVVQQVRDTGSQIIRSMSFAPLSGSTRDQWSMVTSAVNSEMGVKHPERVGRYELLEVIGRGGMGLVYKAFDPAMSRHIAIKVVYSDTLANPTEMLRLQQEAQMAGQLSHPNIVTLYDVSYQQDAAYIIMEYLEGRTLAELMRGNTIVSASFAVDIIEQVAAGLDEAHRHGIVHRDMKPSNIMILDDRRVKITDFGLAKLMRGSTLTRPGHLIGTPSYMSPEQARGVEVSPQSDQFSLGIVAYRMLVGRLPFDGEMFQNVIHQIAEGDPYPIASDDLPEATMLSKVLFRAMARSDRERYISCRDFAADLRRWLHHALENQKTPAA